MSIFRLWHRTKTKKTSNMATLVCLKTTSLVAMLATLAAANFQASFLPTSSGLDGESPSSDMCQVDVKSICMMVERYFHQFVKPLL